MILQRVYVFVIFVLCFVVSPAIVAQEKKDVNEFTPFSQPEVEKVTLEDVLDAVKKNSNKQFLMNSRISPMVAIGQIEVRDTDYSDLLQILRNNDLAAYTQNGIVNIVPVGLIRQYPLPEFRERGGSLDEGEWVTGVMQLENAPAKTMIPILRPLMPQGGHLAANPISNSVVIVDRLGNARRILSIIRKLDEASPTQIE